MSTPPPAVPTTSPVHPDPDPQRRALLVAPLAAAALPSLAQAQATSPRRLRVAFSSAETSFDPARIIDLYSRTVTSHIFESLYAYDHLARPVQFRPLLADGMPEHSEDYRVWTVRLKRGVLFTDDPVFKGQPRELVAADVLYAFRRIADPANKSPAATSVLDEGFVGLAALRKAALDGRKPFDYDAPIEGLQALDRHTVRFVLAEPRPRFIQTLAANDLLGAQAREVVEAYGDKIGEHPVGTGPYRLKRWVRGSKILLERNPGYRHCRYEDLAQPAADDTEGQALLAKFRGRALPLVDEVEVSVIEENQPLWLAFLNTEIDGLASNAGPLPGDFAPQAVPNGQLAPNLARRGIRLYRQVRTDAALVYFNMEDPVVGGYTPEQVALRRAISLAYDVQREIRLIRRGQAIPAQSPIVPGTTGYEAAFRSSMSEYDPARAKALLDTYGFVDRDGDGWRERPDGSPLKLTIATEPEQIYRLFNDLWRRCLEAVGIRCEFEIAQWPSHMKQALAGSLQVWLLGSSADVPDGQSALARLYGPQSGQQNLARFKLPAFDKLYERMLALPDGEERNRLFLEAKRIAATYMPYKYLVHRMANDLLHPWVTGYRRTLFWNQWWHLVDVDAGARAAARR